MDKLQVWILVRNHKIYSSIMIVKMEEITKIISRKREFNIGVV